MAKVKLINPAELAPPIGFAHVAVSDGWIWLGGQISSDANGVLVHPGDLIGQFKQAMRNVLTALAAANCQPQDVVKLTYYVIDVAAYRAGLREIGIVYREIMGRHFPASTLVAVAGLFEPGAMIEIECVARQMNESESGR